METSRGVFRFWFSRRGIFRIFMPGEPATGSYPEAAFPWPELKDELERYFRGGRWEFSCPLDTSCYTPFTGKVLDVVSRIPYGEVYSYRQVAGQAGFPRSWRATGRAVGANRHPLLVPCHRVIRADGKMGGFGSGIAWKTFLLELEAGTGSGRAR